MDLAVVILVFGFGSALAIRGLMTLLLALKGGVAPHPAGGAVTTPPPSGEDPGRDGAQVLGAAAVATAGALLFLHGKDWFLRVGDRDTLLGRYPEMDLRGALEGASERLPPGTLLQVEGKGLEGYQEVVEAMGLKLAE